MNDKSIVISPKRKLVSIVMLCWNRKEEVFESLAAMRKIAYGDIETIVVDNGSTDGTCEMIESKFPEIKLIRMAQNIGIEAYNIGFAQAKGEYIVIIDDDSFPAPQAINRMVERFEQDERLGAVAFDVRNFYHYDEIHAMEKQSEESAAAVSSLYYMGFNGAGVGIRASLFREIGYYPEEFFLYNNEIDTAFRIWDAGYRVEFFSDIVSYHKYSPVNRSSWRAPFYYTRNAFWLLWKNYPLPQAILGTVKLIYRCLYATMEQRTWVYMRAIADAFLSIDKIKGKRKPVRPDLARKIRVPYEVFFTFYR